MTPSRCHAGLAAAHLGLATAARDDLRRGLLLALGLRHVAEAAWLRRPTAARRRVARWVDTTHAATAVVWGMSRRDRRREGALSVGLSVIAVACER